MKQSYEHCDLLCLLLDTIYKKTYEHSFVREIKGQNPNILGRDETESKALFTLY